MTSASGKETLYERQAEERRGVVTYVRPRMGTLLAATFAGADRDAAMRWADIAFTTATHCERVMSRHDRDSDLSRLNQEGMCDSRALASALRRARVLAEKTDGAFDPTVGPLIDVWRRAGRRGTVPSRRALARARVRVDWSAIQLHRCDLRAIRADRSCVTLARDGVALDLGAIGKGLALDRITARLRRAGCRSAILNFGESSIVALGPAPRGEWTVALRHPRGGFAGEFTLRDRACSTSGTMGQTVTVGRRRASHVIDPRSGTPLRGVAQATVIARSAAVAEAASTALLVLGPGAMNRLAKQLHVEACWIDAGNVTTTPDFGLRRHLGVAAEAETVHQD